MRTRTFSQNRLAVVSGCLVLGAVALAGCGQKDQTPTTVVNTPSPASSATTTSTTGTTTTTTSSGTPGTNNTNAGPGGPTGENTAVADAVNKAIIDNKQMTGSRITAVVDASGVCTLTGRAQNQQQKALAERAAHNTSGVTSVKNKVEISPTGGMKAKPKPTTVTKVIVVPAPTSNSTGMGNKNGSGSQGANTSGSNTSGANTPGANTSGASNAPAMPSGTGQ